MFYFLTAFTVPCKNIQTLEQNKDTIEVFNLLDYKLNIHTFIHLIILLKTHALKQKKINVKP